MRRKKNTKLPFWLDVRLRNMRLDEEIEKMRQEVAKKKYLAIMTSYGEPIIERFYTEQAVELEVERRTGDIDLAMAIAAWFVYAPVGERLTLTKFDLEVRK